MHMYNVRVQKTDSNFELKNYDLSYIVSVTRVKVSRIRNFSGFLFTLKRLKRFIL